MTIDDELLLELFKPDEHGKIGENALIANVVGTRDIQYSLEKSISLIDQKHYSDLNLLRLALEMMITPDITISLTQKEIAIELENDVAWDFGKSLRQIRKYEERFKDVRVIIPEKFKRFAPLYKNEGFRCYLWKAKRQWRCLRCNTITVNESRIPPACSSENCSNKSRDQFDLVGLEDTRITEYE